MPDDRGFDALLRHTLERSEPTSACVEAEVIASWYERRLAPDEATAVEHHLAACARCQSVAAAMARSAPAAPVVLPLTDRWRLRWIVPLTAAAAVMLIWIATDGRVFEPGESQGAPEQRARAEPTAPPPAPSPAPPPPPAQREALVGSAAKADEAAPAESLARRPDDSAGAQADTSATARQEAVARTAEAAADTNADTNMMDGVLPIQGQSGEAFAQPSEAPPPPAAPPLPIPGAPPPAAALASTAGPIDISSPDTAVRWRIHPDGRVERTTSGGASWAPVAVPPGAVITTGSAPAPAVCWLVGRSGVVLVSNGDAPLRRVPFPETGDLVAVAATDAASAMVTTADGRVLATADGGVTWARP